MGDYEVVNSIDRVVLGEREVIVGLTCTACRLIGLCLRDGREDLIDRAIPGLLAAIDGLENFGALAGSDYGANSTVIALKQIVRWLKARDEAAARAAFDERYETSDEKFVASIQRAHEENMREIRRS